MKFNNFSLRAEPYIAEAHCSRCGKELVEVSNGFISSVMFCPSCELFFELKLVKIRDDKISKEFLEQSRKEASKKLNF